MKESDGFLVVYSKVDPQSFQNAEIWCENIIREKNNTDVPIVICGNKSDIEEILVSPEEGEELASKFGAKFFETSSKWGINVTEAFTALVSLMQKYKRLDVKIHPNTENKSLPPKDKKMHKEVCIIF